MAKNSEKSGTKQAKRATELRDLISYHDHLYYNLDKPEIADYEYDKLFAELLEIEQSDPGLISADSPTQRVGGQPLAAFEKADHRMPMLSLQNTYSPEEIREFDARVRKLLQTDEAVEYFCEPKFDGLAIELVYENGHLSHALTRGDGLTGELVTSNIKTIKSIPLRLHKKDALETYEVRGEILMFKRDFAELNRQQQELGLDTFANPRNAAAGSIRQLDPKVTASRTLRIFCYAQGFSSQQLYKTQSQFVKYLNDCGLPTTPIFRVCKGADQAIEFYHEIQKKRHDLPFDLDGVVIKVNSLSLQNELGQIARSPRWATAAKFPPEQAKTIIENILVQVGRTGALTPVAIMKPVRVGGVTVTNATLHNQDELARKDVRIGDTVFVQRAGDVIPEIVNVDLKARPKSAVPFKMPTKCPECQSATVRNVDESAIRCSNPLCPAIIREGLKHFVSRRAMNIEKIGDKLVDHFVAAGLVRIFSDFYHLKAADLLQLERQGEKSTANILESIETSKKVNLGRFIYALGFRYVGEQTAKILAQHFKSIENLQAASEEELCSVEGVGEKIAQSLFAELKKSSTKKEIDRLVKSGVQIQNPATKSVSKSGVLDSLNIVVTGTLPMARDEVKNLIEEHGGKSASSVSKKTSYVLAGEEAGSKLEKARELDVPILTWDEFTALLKR